jgi:hypothetical protein
LSKRALFIPRCSPSLFFILVPFRLKARKFQLVAQKTSLGSTTVTTTSPSTYSSTAFSSSSFHSAASYSTSVELLSHQLPTVLPTSLPLPLPESYRDSLFDADVERVRKELKDSDLKRKLAILSEAWAREAASAGAASAGSEEDAEDRVGFDLEHRKRSTSKALHSDADNFWRGVSSAETTMRPVQHPCEYRSCVQELVHGGGE